MRGIHPLQLKLYPVEYLNWKGYSGFGYQLLHAQVETLIGNHVFAGDAFISKDIDVSQLPLLNRLAFIQRAEVDGMTIIPDQVKFEGSSPRSRLNANYLGHGWHRYVGRFPPHIVRTLINIAGLGPGQKVLDPFAGSGTTLLEAQLMGIDAIGIEICPLSYHIAKLKTSLHVDVTSVRKGLEDLIARIKHDVDIYQSNGKARSDAPLVDAETATAIIPDFPNKLRWFNKDMLDKVSIASYHMREEANPDVQAIAVISLSNYLRWFANIDAQVVRPEYKAKDFSRKDLVRILTRGTNRILSDIAYCQELGVPLGNVEVHHDDARKLELETKVDMVITSRPYGLEAVSYLSTHMLSYFIFNWFLRDTYQQVQSRTVGRETGVSSLDVDFQSLFSPTARDLVTSIHEKNPRRAVHYAKYYAEMEDIFARAQGALVPGGWFAMVVGNNITQNMFVPNHQIFAELAKRHGLTPIFDVPFKLVCNNPTSIVPWNDKVISREHVMLWRKAGA